jgi:spermidine/putrescine transport system substrate-binding protein
MIRSITHLLILALLAGQTASCEKKPQPTATPQQINVLCWSEYIPPELVENFQDETHVRVNIDAVASNEAMLTKLLSGATRYDVVQPSDYLAERLIKQGKLAALDLANIDNFKNILPEFKDPPFDAGNRFTVPYMSGTVGIVYNAEKIKSPITGFKDVFKPEHAGRIVVVNDDREIVSWAMIVHGIPVNDVTKENLDKVRPTLAEWVKLVKKYDSDSPKTDLLQGNLDIGIVWNGEAAIVINQDKRFKWVVPAEGTHQYLDSLAIPADATNQRAAEQFINFLLRPENSRTVSEHWPYTNPNGEARKTMSQQQLANPASFPELKNPQTFRDIGASSELIDQLMTELRGSR